MFKIYHSNDLDVQKDILCHLIETQPQSDALAAETILVQSPGMAQWLQLKLAEKNGIAANFHFPMPASFIWQQYVANLPNVSEKSLFAKEAMTWRLMQLFDSGQFQPILHYLGYAQQNEQQKCYQLAHKIADLFDQYLVYRPNWIQAWEQQQDEQILAEILQKHLQATPQFKQQIAQDIAWQGQLWRALVNDIKQQDPNAQHRAALHQQYLQLNHYQNLPTRLFIFGISALPQTYLQTLAAISQHCDVHLFFNNPCEYYWGDIVDPQFAQHLHLKQVAQFKQMSNAEPMLPTAQLEAFNQGQRELSSDQEYLSVGNPLLSTWGKLGRDFLYLLAQLDTQDIQANTELAGSDLLTQIKRKILHLSPSEPNSLHWKPQDDSIAIQACHSPMREVELLHDYLLQCFQQDTNLTLKDIVVMIADIDRYAPYIQAVFGQYQHKIWDDKRKIYAYDPRYIPFSIADETLSENDVLLASYLNLLNLKESQFDAESVLELLEVPAIRAKFQIELEDLAQIRQWVEQSGIRVGLQAQAESGKNYNAWQAGLERMLLGFAMREENGIWQQQYLAFDGTQGLKSELAGKLAAFVQQLMEWHQQLQQPYEIQKWQQNLTALLTNFFAQNEQSTDIFYYILEKIQQLTELVQEVGFSQPLAIEVIADALKQRLDEQAHSLKFLVGNVSFCTLLPMRSIPFKVVCLLGMNEQDYPRQQTKNSFDLMQYHQQKGDRLRREDDRYLFLEALLAAQQRLYISYVGQSIVDNSSLEPSVLVNQLLDYLYENLDQIPPAEPDQKPLVQYHAMTAFSAKNFSEKHRTFAHQWAKVSQIEQPIQDFLQPLNDSMETAQHELEIDCTQLVRFVQNPVKFFFEQRLGVYFSKQDELIADSENFDLDNWDLYQIRQDLLSQPNEDIEPFMAQLALKGILPRGEFAQLYQHKVRWENQQFYQILQPYLSLKPQSQPVDLSFEIHGRTVRLTGYLQHLLQLTGEPLPRRVEWRAGKHKDSYRIENWLYFLIQSAMLQDVAPSPYFYALDDKNQPKGQYFAVTENFDAQALLAQYIEAYLATEQRMVLAVTQQIDSYLKKIGNEQDCIENIEKIAYGDEYAQFDASDIYWQRLLKQTSNLADLLPEINQNTQNWFGSMINNINSL